MLSWIRGKQFAPPLPPLRDYWVTLHVKLHEPTRAGGQDRASTYFQVLGLRCSPIRLRSFLQECTSDGAVIWGDDTHWHEVSLNQLRRELRASFRPEAGECIWYEEGRVYVPDTGQGF